MKWIRKSQRPKSEIFICPRCKKEVRYIDGQAKRGIREAECEYTYCPWCIFKIRVNDISTGDWLPVDIYNVLTDYVDEDTATELSSIIMKLVIRSYKVQIEKIMKTIFKIEEMCFRLYSKTSEFLKSKGVTDDEIFNSNLHLYLNSINAFTHSFAHQFAVFREEKPDENSLDESNQ